MLELPKIIMMSNLVVFATDLYFVLWARLAGRSVQSYKEWAFFSIFSRLGLYPQVFGQVKKWLIVGFREIGQVPHIVACLIDFNLRCDRGQQDGVLKPKKIFIFSIFSHLGPFSQVFGQVIEIAWNNKSITITCVVNGFYFALSS